MRPYPVCFPALGNATPTPFRLGVAVFIISLLFGLLPRQVNFHLLEYRSVPEHMRTRLRDCHKTSAFQFFQWNDKEWDTGPYVFQSLLQAFSIFGLFGHHDDGG